MRRLICLVFVGSLVGCAAIGNKATGRDTGFQPQDMGTAKAGRDLATTINITVNMGKRAAIWPYDAIKRLIWK